MNSTLSGSAHFLRFRTPRPVVAHSLIFLPRTTEETAWLMPSGIDTDPALSLCVLNDVVCSRSDLRPSLARTHPCTTRTSCTQTPLSTSTTRKPTSRIAVPVSALTMQEAFLAIFLNEPVLHDQDDTKPEPVHETYLRDPAV